MAKPVSFHAERADGYVISTDRTRIDAGYVHRYLSESSYWAQGRSRELQDAAMAQSLCIGIYQGQKQVGFARVVTDYATFGWLCDVFVDEAHRGRGLGKWLIETIVAQPPFDSIRRLMLATRDAHELYRRYGGFDALPAPERFMTRTNG